MPKVFDDIPSVGTIFEWDIDEILSRPSADTTAATRYSSICINCGDVNYDDWGYNYDDCQTVPYLEHEGRKPTLTEAWDMTLERKREDEHYEDVLYSIRDRGFVRPLTSFNRDGQLILCDGHHRLAAAIDLGLTTVTVIVRSGWDVAHDSGDWYADCDIPSLEEAHR